MRNTLVKKSLLGGHRALIQRDTENAGGGGGAATDDDAGGANTDDADDDHDGDDSAEDKSATFVSQADYDRVKEHLSKADSKKSAALRELAKATAELEQLRNKDKPEAERLQSEYKQLVAERDTLQTRYATMARTNAFLLASSAAKLNWANAAAALRVADLADLEIEDDGTVPGMDDAVKALALEHPYLVAATNSTDTKDEKDTKKPPVKSGSVVGGKGKGVKADEPLSDEELKRLFPALY